MYPVLGRWGDLTLYSYGVLNLASVFLFVGMMAWLLRVRRRNLAPAIDLALLMVLGYTIGAKLLFTVLSGDWGLQSLNFGFWGGQIAFGVLALAYLAAFRDSFAPVADALAVTWAAATVLHKLGCFLGGCCGGSPSTMPWALGGAHPVQLYDSIFALALTAILAAAFFRDRAGGRLLLWWGLGYAATKFATEWFRGDARFMVAGPVTAAMLAEVATAIGCAALLARPGMWTRLAERHDRRLNEPVPSGTPGRLFSFVLGLGGFVAAATGAAIASMVLSWPGAPFVVFAGLFVFGELLGVQSMLGFMIVDRRGRSAAMPRLFLRALAGVLTPFTFFGMFRPLFDRQGRSLADAVSGTWTPRAIPRSLPGVAP